MTVPFTKRKSIFVEESLTSKTSQIENEDHDEQVVQGQNKKVKFIDLKESSDFDIQDDDDDENDEFDDECDGVIEVLSDIDDDDDEEYDGDELEGDEFDEEEDQQQSKEGEAQDDNQPKSSKEMSFANAINRILEKPLEKKAPILSRNSIEKRIDDKKLEARAKKMMRMEKKVKKAQDHVERPGEGDAEAIEFEKKLRKMATRGVVKLFNAIRIAQNTAEKVTEGTILQKAAAVPSVTKETFLNAIQKKKEEKDSTTITPQSSAVLTNNISRESTTTSSRHASTTTTTDENKSGEAAVAWLQSDFMTKNKTKHWDESSEAEF